MVLGRRGGDRILLKNQGGGDDCGEGLPARSPGVRAPPSCALGRPAGAQGHSGLSLAASSSRAPRTRREAPGPPPPATATERNKCQTFPRSLAPSPARGSHQGTAAVGVGVARGVASAAPSPKAPQGHFGFSPRRPQPRGPRCPCPWTQGESGVRGRLERQGSPE